MRVFSVAPIAWNPNLSFETSILPDFRSKSQNNNKQKLPPKREFLRVYQRFGKTQGRHHGYIIYHQF